MFNKINKLYYFGLCLSTLLVLTSCTQSTSADNKKQTEQATKAPTSNKTNIQQGTPGTSAGATSTDRPEFLTGEVLNTSDSFKAHQFALSYNSKDNSLHIHMAYSFAEAPKQFLMNGRHTYYFYVNVPERLAKYFVSSKSDVAEGEQLTKEKVDYGIDLRIPLKDHLPAKTIQSIVNNPTEYKLTIYENPKYEAFTIINVYEGIKTQP